MTEPVDDEVTESTPETDVEKMPPEELEVERNRAVLSEMARVTRRSFAVGAVATVAGYSGWRFLRSRPMAGSLPWPFRRMLETNESLWRGYFNASRMSPTFLRSEASKKPRVNGHIGLSPTADLTSWKLKVEGLANGDREFLLDDIKQLPRVEMVTELRCIEGWSIIVHWAGARLRDFIETYPPRTRSGAPAHLEMRPEDLPSYVSIETPGREYYVGLDMPTAHHSQTLLCYEINNAPLSWDHGAPLRLVTPLKYGIKNIKRIGRIVLTDQRPADFWAERGYDWYAGH